MANQRLFIWIGVLALLWLNYVTWQKDYAPPPVPVTQSAPAPGASGAPGSSLGQSLPAGSSSPGGPAATLPGAATSGPVSSTTGAPPAPPAGAAPAFAAAAPSDAPTIHVRTDVLDLTLSTVGGELQRVDLIKYPKEKKAPDVPVRLFNKDSETTLYLFQSGLRTGDSGAEPNHLAQFTAPKSEYVLAEGQNELAVPLAWTGADGLSVVKTFTFRRGSYAIDLRQDVQNGGTAPRSVYPYAQILRHWEHTSRSMWDSETYAFKGPAIFDGAKYRKLDVENAEDSKLDQSVTNGWLAAMQHHFVVAIVPAAGTAQQFTVGVKDKDFLLRTVGPATTVAPGASVSFDEQLFAGPKLQEQLEPLHPKLTQVTDYGKYLFVIAKPLYTLLAWVHKVVGNWGWAIIIVTFLIKLAFYKLAETSGRSMAKMRNLQPRMKDIQERYKDDRDALGRAMMELYKREKINPVAGCLPILVQIPVFMGFYWVLLESVEMRQAPWMLWVNDLSARDPYFILPIIMAGAMYGQFKLNPAPPDPIQAKVFAFMPIVMSAMMAFFPAGLVLYWITNTGLSILQQWRINKVVEQEANERRK